MKLIIDIPDNTYADKDEPTVCDIDAIKKRIMYETNKFDITKGFAYCSGWFDALMFANDIIDEHIGGKE